jgi:PAS domain S-box-containing protein
MAGVYFRYPLFFNLDFLFASIFALLALQFLGPARGLLAALFIGSYTFFLWHHPWALVVLTAELAVVGWLVTRRKMELVLADTLYWLCLGMPLVFLFYHVVMHYSTGNVNLAMVKQALNGIANALIARLLFTGHALYSRTLTISFREILNNLLAVFVLCPALIVLAVGSRADFDETDRGIRTSLLRNSRHVSSNLDHWLNARKVLCANLAELAATLPPEQMQARLEQARGSDLYLLRIGLHDQNAVTIAHSPLTEPSGQSNLGKSFADRPFIPALRRTLKPMLSELVQGKIDSARPRALMLAPVLRQGAYAGYIAGVLNLDRVRAIIDENSDSDSTLYTLIDNNGRIILTNRKDQKPLTPLVPSQGELKHLDEGISQWLPPLSSGIATGKIWRRSSYIKRSSVGNFAEWELVLEQPVAPFQELLYDRYADKLGLLLLIFLAALALAEILSRRIDASIRRLSGLTSDLPARLSRGQQVTWPESPVLELRDLMGNLQKMTHALKARFTEIREFGEEQAAGRSEELSSLNRDFVSFLENAPYFIFFKDGNSRFRFCSQAMANITGHASWRDLIGKNAFEVFPKEQAQPCFEEELAILRDGIPLLNKTDSYCDSQGKRGWASTNKWPVYDEAGKVVGIFGISRDMTEMMQIQESLRLARQSLDQVPDPIMWVDLDGLIVDCNEGACQCLGYSQQELLGSSMFAIDPIATAENWPEFFAQLRTQRVRHFESSFLTKEGRSIPMDVQVTHISFGDKEFLCGIARDITERTLMESKLRQSEASLSRAQAIAKLGSWEWDPATDGIVCSKENFNIFGIDPERCSGNFTALVGNLVHPEDRTLVLEAGERARRTGIGQTVEYRIVRPDGAMRWIRAIGEFVHEQGRPAKMIGANQDVTERKLMEEERLNLERQMLYLQKLESLGVLSGGIAHDFNNLLQVVLGNLDLTLMVLPEESAVRKNLEQAVIATVRASELSGMMLAYSGKGVLAINEMNLSTLVQENSAMLSALLPENLTFSSALDQALPPVQADATQLLQVLMSLVRNASEAIGEGSGSITLATGVQQYGEPSLRQSRLEDKLGAGRYVWVEVSDTGCGMDEATQYKIFDPFFTTKFTGRGLGMSAAQGIMRAHKGAILLESSPGAGTTVRLLFPIASGPQTLPQAIPQAIQAAAAAAGCGQRGAILVVDDEEMIRTLSVAMLEAFGFDTLVATDGEMALEIFRSEGDRISLVLLDQSMPIMDGLTVFRELRRIRPDIKVLLASGYSEEEVSERFKGLQLDGFIQKPYTVKRLSDEVQRVLETRG